MPPSTAESLHSSPTPTLVDSHCHLDFPDFSGEIDAVVARAQAAGVASIVTISTRIKRHGEVLAIAERFPQVYCSVGTHPHHAHEELDIPVEELIARTRHPKVVAIGEAGLDYHYELSTRDAQERGLRNHIAAARAAIGMAEGEGLALPWTCAVRGRARRGVLRPRSRDRGGAATPHGGIREGKG